MSVDWGFEAHASLLPFNNVPPSRVGFRDAHTDKTAKAKQFRNEAFCKRVVVAAAFGQKKGLIRSWPPILHALYWQLCSFTLLKNFLNLYLTLLLFDRFDSSLPTKTPISPRPSFFAGAIIVATATPSTRQKNTVHA